jgi:hypothetical protein
MTGILAAISAELSAKRLGSLRFCLCVCVCARARFQTYTYLSMYTLARTVYQCSQGVCVCVCLCVWISVHYAHVRACMLLSTTSEYRIQGLGLMLVRG